MAITSRFCLQVGHRPLPGPRVSPETPPPGRVDIVIKTGSVHPSVQYSIGVQVDIVNKTGPEHPSVQYSIGVQVDIVNKTGSVHPFVQYSIVVLVCTVQYRCSGGYYDENQEDKFFGAEIARKINKMAIKVTFSTVFCPKRLFFCKHNHSV